MNDNKINIGLLIPTTTIVFFFISLISENYLNSLFIVIFGTLLWFIYSAVLEIEMPSFTGNIIMILGILVSLAFFLTYGITKNMFGGYVVDIEAAAGSAILLFFSVLLSVLFKNKAYNGKVRRVDPIATKQIVENNVNSTPDEDETEDVEDYYSNYYEDMEDYYSDIENDDEE